MRSISINIQDNVQLSSMACLNCLVKQNKIPFNKLPVNSNPSQVVDGGPVSLCVLFEDE